MDFAIRRLGPEDAEAYRAFRLFMLEDAPEAFGDSVEEAEARPLQVWTDDLSGDRAGFRITGTTPRSLLVGDRYIDEHEMVCFFDKEHDNE